MDGALRVAQRELGDHVGAPTAPYVVAFLVLQGAAGGEDVAVHALGLGGLPLAHEGEGGAPDDLGRGEIVGAAKFPVDQGVAQVGVFHPEGARGLAYDGVEEGPALAELDGAFGDLGADALGADKQLAQVGGPEGGEQQAAREQKGGGGGLARGHPVGVGPVAGAPDAAGDLEVAGDGRGRHEVGQGRGRGGFGPTGQVGVERHRCGAGDVVKREVGVAGRAAVPERLRDLVQMQHELDVARAGERRSLGPVFAAGVAGQDDAIKTLHQRHRRREQDGPGAARVFQVFLGRAGVDVVADRAFVAGARREVGDDGVARGGRGRVGQGGEAAVGLSLPNREAGIQEIARPGEKPRHLPGLQLGRPLDGIDARAAGLDGAGGAFELLGVQGGVVLRDKAQGEERVFVFVEALLEKRVPQFVTALEIPRDHLGVRPSKRGVAKQGRADADACEKREAQTAAQEGRDFIDEGEGHAAMKWRPDLMEIPLPLASDLRVKGAGGLRRRAGSSGGGVRARLRSWRNPWRNRG